MENSNIKKNNKIIETVNYNGKYIDASTMRAKIISAAIALAALAVSVSAIILF